MARIEDGELYLEIKGASEEQVKEGLAAARESLELAGVDLREAFAAQARVDAAGLTELAWEQGARDDYDEPAEEDVELEETIGEAWFAAVRAAGFDPSVEMTIGRFGLVGDDRATTPSA